MGNYLAHHIPQHALELCFNASALQGKNTSVIVSTVTAQCLGLQKNPPNDLQLAERLPTPLSLSEVWLDISAFDSKVQCRRHTLPCRRPGLPLEARGGRPRGSCLPLSGGVTSVPRDIANRTLSQWTRAAAIHFSSHLWVSPVDVSQKTTKKSCIVSHLPLASFICKHRGNTTSTPDQSDLHFLHWQLSQRMFPSVRGKTTNTTSPPETPATQCISTKQSNTSSHLCLQELHNLPLLLFLAVLVPPRR